MHMLTSYCKLFLSCKILILTDVEAGINKNIYRLLMQILTAYALLMRVV
jgi:hypothetical protein